MSRSMKIVIAPNAFKGSATAAEAAAAIARGASRAAPDATVDLAPVADGGDGLHDLAIAALGGEEVRVTVTGPRFEPVDAAFVLDRSREQAVVESARASGLGLVAAGDLDPTRTTTVGTGELLRAALNAGARHVLVGLGGSATNDGGVGLAAALGWRFLDAAGEPVSPIGGELSRIRAIDGAGRDPRLDVVRIEVACDVDNPLCGPRGAAAVYGPQKGATPGQVRTLDAGLAHLADLVAEASGTDARDAAGAGAAGGLGFGLAAFAGAALRRGSDVVLDMVEMDRRLEGADLVITGEGRIDAQTAAGKAPAAVAERAAARGIPCAALAGTIDACAARACGFRRVLSICPDAHSDPGCVEASMADPGPRLERGAEELVRAFIAGKR